MQQTFNKLKKDNNHLKLLLIIGLVLFAVSFRLMPHPANFTPIAALALFGGAVLPRRWALSLPLAAIVISDLFLGVHSLILFTWGSFLLIALLSSKYLNKIKPKLVIGGSLLASVLFFVVTNFGVWLEGRLYPLTTEGLIACYYNALPFFRNTLLGDLVFSVMLFGIYALVTKFVLNSSRQQVTLRN